MSLFTKFIKMFKRIPKKPINVGKTYFAFITALVHGLECFDAVDLRKFGFSSEFLNMPDLFDRKYETLVDQSRLVYGILERNPKKKKKMLHHRDMKTFFREFFTGDQRHLNDASNALLVRWRDVTCLEATLTVFGHNRKTIWNYMTCVALFPHDIDGYLMTHWFSEISWTMDPHTEIEQTLSAKNSHSELKQKAIKRYQAIREFLIKYRLPVKCSHLENAVTFEEFNEQFFGTLNGSAELMKLFLHRNAHFAKIFIEETSLEG